MITNVTVPARLCQCEECGYSWVSILAPDRIPTHCQNRTCRSREWNGKKPKRVPEKKPQVVLPKPVKVRPTDEEEDF